MSDRGKTILLVMLIFFVFASLSAAEDLYVVEKAKSDVNTLAKLPEVYVYGILKNVFLIGATPSGESSLEQNRIAAVNIGERDRNSEYFIFQIDKNDIDKLGKNVDIIYFRDNEAIARTSGPMDQAITLLLRRLTRVSFVPRQPIKLGAYIPAMRLENDPQIEAIVAQVSQAQFTDYIQTMQDFVTRYSYTSGCRAAEQWARTTLTELGYTTELFPFDYSGNTWNDVIGRKTGMSYPDSIYIIIGHLDSYSEIPNSSAPGAEDNASGSACVLEAARVFSQIDLDCTVEFVVVTGEEQGLIGSEAYAQYCLSNNRNIAGVLNFDMISYAGGYGWDTNIFSDQNFPAEVALADLLGQLTDDYSTAYSVRVNTNGPEYGSDHYYFSIYGFPAPFSIDAQLWGAPDWYDWYHTTSDVIGNLDLDFGTEVVKGAVAALATVAGLYTPPILVFNYPNGLPETVEPAGGTSFRVEVTAGTGSPQPGTGLLYYDTGTGFTSTPMQVVAPNVYDAVFPAVDCGADVAYYVSAQATDGAIVTDPASAPAVSYSAIGASASFAIYEDDFDSNLGWTLSGLWGVGTPLGGGGEYGNPDPSTDHSPDGPNNVLGYNLNGDYENNLPERNATSPIIDCSSYFGVTLKFYRWLGVEQPTYDHAYLRVSSDGTNWSTVFSNSQEITDNSWVEQVFDVSQWADGQANFRVRFVMGPTDGGWRYCGWNIDDLTLTGYYCNPILTGACCNTVSGSCMQLTESECLAGGGAFKGVGSACQGDADGDGFDGICDNCPDMYNPGQEDTDGDGIGDACDTQDVPTLSEWGMIALGLLLVALSTINIVRRKRRMAAAN